MCDNSRALYQSVIKVNGKPILPPIITPELRKELHSFKQQAMKLEQRLKKCRDLKRQLDNLLEIQNKSTRSESQLTFNDNSHIEALNISEKEKPPKILTTNSGIEASNVGNKLNPRKLKNIHLSKDLIEVTQYNSNGLKTICSNVEMSDGKEKVCDIKETEKNISNNLASNRNIIVETDSIRSKSATDLIRGTLQDDLPTITTPPKPRLIRSNSYTLECPSPILLEHLKKTSDRELHSINQNNLASARNWTSLENNHTPFESSDFSSMNTVFHQQINDNSEIVSTPDKSSRVIEETKSPTIEVYQTDISVQQITVNTLDSNGFSKEEKKEIFFSKNPFETFEPDSEILNVLKDIPDQYANQIMELLRKQHLEQKERLERYDDLNEKADKLMLNSDCYKSQTNFLENPKPVQSSVSSNQKLPPSGSVNSENLIDLASLSGLDFVKEIDGINTNSSRPSTTESCTSSTKPPSERLRRSSTFSVSPSQSLYYSVSSDTDTLTNRLTPSVNPLGEVDTKPQENLEIGVLRQKNGYWEGILKHDDAKNSSCSRELFPEIDPVTINSLKQEWAARIIGAHVKGYLTRRLIKTQKVQNLIATVKDVLVCAVELHHSDNIDEKDVELHRRLINQLSAALYSFHDIFFELTTQEQMQIIAADRQRKREKPKRPQSGRSSARSKSIGSNQSDKSLNSSRSSSKHKLIRESPSLTKV